MKHYDSAIIGHITMDNNIDHLGNSINICGGAVLFSSAAAHALGHKVAAITRVADADSERLSHFTIPKKDVFVIPSKSSTTMRNKYFTADKERRECTCISLGDHFTDGDIPDCIEADIYHFAGLIYGDFPNSIIKKCVKKGAVALDVQTCLRHADMTDGSTFFEDWADKAEMLPLVTFLKTDAAEAEIMTGLSDRYKAAELLHSWGAKEVLITHNTEVIAFDGSEMRSCPIRARNLSGRTGRGDTTFASYINERLNCNLEKSLLYATAMVSLKMEKPGPFNGTRQDITDYINEFYNDYIK